MLTIRSINKEVKMSTKTLTKVIPTESQYDVTLQEGCADDCPDIFGNSSFEMSILSGQGFNVINPTQAELVAGVTFAVSLGIDYCYRLDTPNTSIYL
jgi:hypothetical protein